MATIIDEKIIEAERELLAMILNKNEVIDLLQIKPEYLASRDNRKMLKYAIECYKEHKAILPVEMMEKHEDFDILLFSELMTEVMWFPSIWKEQLNSIQEAIFKNYKEEYIKNLNERLKNGNIKYEEFITKLKKI